MSQSPVLRSRSGRTQWYFTALVGVAGVSLAACAGPAPSQAGAPPPPAEPPVTTSTQPASPVVRSPPAPTTSLEAAAVADGLADPAVLPAVFVPTRGPVLHRVVAGGDADPCDVSTCVPPGIYEQQPATGDWCAWTYSPAGEAHDATVRSWKDADGQQVTLNEGDLLSYGPSDGAIELSGGVDVVGAGDGVRRGCAEWVQVDHPEAATTLTPTVEECRQVIDSGERATAALGSLSRELTETMQRFQILDLNPPAELAGATVADILEVVETVGDLLGAFRGEVLKADPKMRNAAACHEALGNTEASDDLIHRASLNRVTFADFGYLLDELRQICPEEYAPFGLHCSRL